MSVFYTVSERWQTRDGHTESDCLLFTDEREPALREALGLRPQRPGGRLAVIAWHQTADSAWAGEEIEEDRP